MHARRRFVEAMLVLNIKGLTDEQVLMLPEAQAILLIREIYLAETPLKSLSPEERLLQRKEKVLPKVNAFFEFIRTIDVTNPSSPAGFSPRVFSFLPFCCLFWEVIQIFGRKLCLYIFCGSPRSNLF